MNPSLCAELEKHIERVIESGKERVVHQYAGDSDENAKNPAWKINLAAIIIII